MNDTPPDLLQRRLRAALDDRAANLDADTLGRLAAARSRALSRRHGTFGLQTRQWQAIGGLALAASVVFGVSLWVHGPLRGPLPPGPAALIAGGETTVTLDTPGGEGGPNQEFALSAALVLSDPDQVVLSLDTDGTDGPTPLAGGLVDASTVQRAKSDGLDLSDVLRRHDVSPVLRRLQDAVVTGHTGTNVNDLKLGLRA